MTTVVTTAALMCAGAGLVVLIAGTSSGRWRDALATMLELWVAAGLLRLTGGRDGGRLVAAAAIVATWALVGRGLRRDADMGTRRSRT